jgi:hypothetical protein
MKPAPTTSAAIASMCTRPAGASLWATDRGDVEQAGALGHAQLDQRTRYVLGRQRLAGGRSELEIRLADQDEQVVLRLEVPDDQGRIGVGGNGDVPDRDVFVSAGREQLPGGRQDAPPGVLATGPAAVDVPTASTAWPSPLATTRVARPVPGIPRAP